MVSVIKISVITVNFNGAKFLEETIKSVISQVSDGVELEYIVIDGGSTDGSLEIINKYRGSVAKIISEPDDGPADALNKGLKLATGEIVAWLNADDCYFPGTFERVSKTMEKDPKAAFCFGHCPIVNEESVEIRSSITFLKEIFFPISSRFTYLCINYISQPAIFFRQQALRKAAPLDGKLVAAWDYKFILGLWRHGGGRYISGSPLSKFRWHEGSISGSSFFIQFREEYEAARDEAGRFHPAVLTHYIVRWLIVAVYSVMALKRRVSET